MSEQSLSPALSLAPADWIVIFLYGLGVFSIAWWAMRHVKDAGGLLLGKRKMGPLMMIAASFAGGTNANHPMAVASATYEKGISGIWISLTWILITPLYWIIPPTIRRLRIVTMIDAVRMRFGATMAMLFKLVSLIASPMAMGLGIKSAAIVVEVTTGGAIHGFGAEAAIAIPTLVYALMGGIIAAYATDMVQGLLIIVLSFLLIPFAIVEAGGISMLDAAINDQLTTLWNTEAGAFGPWWIFWFAVACTSSAVMSTGGGAAAARNEMAARTKVFGMVGKRFCTIGWGITGLIGIALYSTDAAILQNPDNVFALASMDLLPTVLRGLMVASILAAVMSSLDSMILSYGGIVVNNIYQEHIKREASPGHYLLMTRIFAGFGLLIGWWIASAIISVVEFTKFFEPVYGLIGVTLLIAIIWRRVTAAGAIAGVLVMAPLFFYASMTQYPGGVEDLPLLFKAPVQQMEAFYTWTGVEATVFENNKLDVPYRYPIYLVPGVFIIVLVSLLTKQHNQREVETFYKRLDTPVGDEHLIRQAGYQVDQLENLDGNDSGSPNTVPINSSERLLMSDILYIPGKLRRGEVKLSQYKMDLAGFIGSIIFVICFVWCVDKGIQWLF